MPVDLSVQWVSTLWCCPARTPSPTPSQTRRPTSTCTAATCTANTRGARVSTSTTAPVPCASRYAPFTCHLPVYNMTTFCPMCLKVRAIYLSFTCLQHDDIMSHVPQGTRRNIHSLTPILIIGHPLSTSSIYCDPQHPFCLLICMHGSLWQSFVSSNHVDRLTLRTLSTQSCSADGSI